MRSLYQDLRYGIRVLRKDPGFTAVAVFTLALGIAVNTTVFSWIDAVLVRPLPGTSDSQRLAVVEIVTTGWNSGTINFNYSDYRTARDNLKLLSGLALHTDVTFNVRAGESLHRVYGELVSGNYFDVLGVKPIRGRVFLPEEYGDTPGAYPVAVISERLWRGRFGSDPAVVGRIIHVNRYPLTVVGVVPAAFHGTKPGLAYEMWVPLMMTPQLNGARNAEFDNGSRDYWAVTRLKPGVAVGQADGELKALVRRLTEMNPRTDEGLTAAVLPVWKAHTGAQGLLRAPLVILMAVCFFVLLIVCANVANLLLARSIARQREFSIRSAIGATRGRLARQMFAEASLLAAFGALAGVLCAAWMAKSLVWLLPPTSLPVALDLKLNADILGFTILVCAVAVLASCMAPVLHSIRIDVNENLKAGGRSGMSSTHSHRMRSTLVVSEVALALVALVGAALFVRSFNTVKAVSPGFEAKDVTVAQLDLGTNGYSPEQGLQFCLRLSERLRSAPGIVGVTYAERMPLGFGLSAWQEIEVEGYTPRQGENMKIYHNAVAPGFFDMMRIPRIEGRDFTEQDDNRAPPVIIINESFSRRFFGDRNPIGRRVRAWGTWHAVVGIVKDSKYHSLAEDPQPFFYHRILNFDYPSITFCVRSAGNSGNPSQLLRRESAAIDPNVAMFDIMPLSEHMGGSLFAQKFAASLLSVLGGVSLLLASIGLYGVMAYTVSQRTPEIGIRMALGAQRSHVLRLVVGQAMLLAGAGILVGTALALAAARLAAQMLFRVSAHDPITFAGVALFLCGVALLASSVPAWRAMRTDPLEALRHE
jgi:predicted permease